MTSRRIEIYVDGGGANGHGIAGCAWLRLGTAFHLERGSGWTCNEAEYRAFISALRHLPVGACATVFSDSLLMVRQFTGVSAASEPRLQLLLNTVRRLILKRDLSIDLVWIPRERNLADALLRLKILGMEPLAVLKRQSSSQPLCRETSDDAPHHQLGVGTSKRHRNPRSSERMGLSAREEGQLPCRHG